MRNSSVSPKATTRHMSPDRLPLASGHTTAQVPLRNPWYLTFPLEIESRCQKSWPAGPSFEVAIPLHGTIKCVSNIRLAGAAQIAVLRSYPIDADQQFGASPEAFEHSLKGGRSMSRSL